MLRNIFEKQDWHFVLLALLAVSVNAIMEFFPAYFSGQFWGLHAKTWLWIGVISAILHQLYAMIIWRTQLETGWLSTTLPPLGYIAYYIDYTMLLTARLSAIALTAVANRDVLVIPEAARWITVLTLAIPVSWLLHSILKYYGFKRLAGADRFETAYRDQSWTRKGIFRIVPKAIYVFGPLVFYIPGFLLASPASLLLALFNHFYLWIHYYCTELPDLKRIYGSGGP